MRRRSNVFLMLSAWSLLSACQAGRNGPETIANTDATEAIPHAVTSRIQKGLTQHIREQIRLGGGYFNIHHEGRELRLKLVNIHTDYLATLGIDRHLVCVDMVSSTGNVYDIDFFLEGDLDTITVTNTTVHKLNGRPFYVWKQTPDDFWFRADTQTASQHHLGVITGRDAFEFLYQARLPKMSENARMWIPLPATDEFQTVHIQSIVAPGKQTILKDKEFDNEVLFLALTPQDSNSAIAIRFGVTRQEKSAYQDKTPDLDTYLAPDRLVPDNEDFRKIAGDVVEGTKGTLPRARALYDHVVERMRYAKFDDGYGKGDAVYACDSRAGNCSDYHSYFIALSRAAGIPSRFAIGAAIPSDRNEGGISGYHCWAEFYADDKWWPIDVSEADKHDSLAPYYFGHHPANRIELSRGRDLVVEPGPASGPINFLAYPVLEVGGKPVKVKPKFSFIRSTADNP